MAQYDPTSVPFGVAVDADSDGTTVITPLNWGFEKQDGGMWTTDGDDVLMDSAEAGADLGVAYPNGGGIPEQAGVPVPAGAWRVRAVHTGGEFRGSA
ncbi:Imm21 family immunity protein [Streptomyces sp. NPDC020917]|uniref:Imm21 family immunity protein n=1 Tax=Streptomyces sp. NPDC020917 TaxID=3365102 RepID=UPI0037912DB2